MSNNDTFSFSLEARKTATIPSSYITLPNELLLIIFEIALHFDSTRDAQETLRCATGVCKHWRRLARPLLLSYVEIATVADASSLLSSYPPEYLPTQTLVVATCAQWSSLIDLPTFSRLLQHARGIRKLVLLHTDYRDRASDALFTAPKELTQLTSLIDVTIAPISSWNPSHTEAGLINCLPSSVRWLHLPYMDIVPPNPIAYPSFSLFGITIHEYPTPVTDWILHWSRSSLQSLVVRSLNSIPQLVGAHPNLRSLKVLGSITPSQRGFRSLSKLERLDIRGLDVPPTLLDTIPPSLQYLRIWSTELAVRFAELLADDFENETFPFLRIVVWDHLFTTDAESTTGLATMRLLGQVCKRKEIELRLSMDARCHMASVYFQADETEYEEEEEFRKSCFRVACVEWGRYFSTSPTYAKLPRTKFPNRAISRVRAQSVYIGPSFTTQDPDPKCAAIWDECFESHGYYASIVGMQIIEAQIEASRALEERTRTELAVRRRQKWRPGRAVALTACVLTVSIFSTALSYASNISPGALVGILGVGSVVMTSLAYVISLVWPKPTPPPDHRQRVTMAWAVGAQMLLVGWQTAMMASKARGRTTVWFSIFFAIVMDITAIGVFSRVILRYFPN